MNPTMRSVLRAYRMDWHKVSSQGWMWVPAAVLAVPVLVTVGAAAHMETLTGGVFGAAIYIYVLILMYPFMYEQQGHGGWMNGLMPVSRRHQVAGRYLLLLTSAGLLLVSCLLTWGGLAVVGAAGAGYFGWISVCLIWVYLIMVSLLCPLMYRFSIQRVGIWFMVVVLVLCFAAVGGLTAVTALVPKAVLDRAIDGVVALADNMMLIPILAVIGIATAGLALAVSFRVSCRCYLAKEL